MVDRVLNGGADQALRALLGDRLDADAAHLADIPAVGVLQKRPELLGLGGAGLDFQPGVDVLGVLAEDHHVDQFGLLYRRRDALEPADRAQADVEIEDLAQRHVQRTEAPADGGGQRALDADEVLAEVGDRLIGKPVARLVEGLLTGEHLLPFDRLAVLLSGGVENVLRGRPDVDADAVAFDEGDDRVVGNGKYAIGAHCDFLSHDRILRWIPDRFDGSKVTCQGRRS